MNITVESEYPINPFNVQLISSIFHSEISGYNTLFTEEVEAIEDIDTTFTCNICFTKKIIGKRLKCRHIFCKKCITKWLTECSNKCPSCRKVLN